MRQLYQHRPEIWPWCQNLLSTLKPKGYGILYNIFLITVFFITNVTQSQTNDENIIFSNLLFLIFCSKAATSKPLDMRSNSHQLTNLLLGFQGLQAMYDQNSLASSPHHNLKGHSTDFTSTITLLVMLSTTQPVKTTCLVENNSDDVIVMSSGLFCLDLSLATTHFFINREPALQAYMEFLRCKSLSDMGESNESCCIMGIVGLSFFKAWLSLGTKSQDILALAASILNILVFNLSFVSPQTLWKCDIKLLECPFKLQIPSFALVFSYEEARTVTSRVDVYVQFNAC